MQRSEEATPDSPVILESTVAIAMATDRAIRLALIVTELVTNAAKHACGKSGGGEIRVRLARKGGTGVSVSVNDNGQGLPANFSLERPSGFGTRMIQVLAQQMGATLASSG